MNPLSSTDPALFNSKGFLNDFSSWSRDLAIAYAESENLELTECHWSVIEFLRDYYVAYEVNPSARIIKKNLSEKLNAAAPCTRHKLGTLFPNGGCKQACRIAGLPDYICQSC